MAKYNKDMIQSCADWVRENGLMDYGGATLNDFLKAMRIDDMTYYRWLDKEEFADAIKRAKLAFRDGQEKEIVNSLVNAAKGCEYNQTITEYMDVNGEPRIKKQTRKNIRVEPNVGAAIFLLTNIAPNRWKNRQNGNIDITTNGKEFKSFNFLPYTPEAEEVKDEWEG